MYQMKQNYLDIIPHEVSIVCVQVQESLKTIMEKQSVYSCSCT